MRLCASPTDALQALITQDNYNSYLNTLFSADSVDVRAQSGLICAPRSMIAEEFSPTQNGGYSRVSQEQE